MCKLEWNDQDLVTAYINGDETALSVLLEKHQAQIFHYILSKIKNREVANDIFQDTFIKVIKTLKSGNYNEEGKFLPWVMRISHNLVIDFFRRENKVRMISESSSSSDEFNVFYLLKDDGLNIEQKITKDEIEYQVTNFIQYLPESQREILMMRIYQDMSFKEIADLKDISINTALGRMRYAVMNIRKLMEKHGAVI
jgi:RNA polymerase sigma-70 factor (ECF subfamily)